MLRLEFNLKNLFIGLLIRPAPYFDRLNIWLCPLPTLSFILSIKHPVSQVYLESHWWLEASLIMAGGFFCEGELFVPDGSLDHALWVLRAYGLTEGPEVTTVDDIPF